MSDMKITGNIRRLRSSARSRLSGISWGPPDLPDIFGPRTFQMSLVFVGIMTVFPGKAVADCNADGVTQVVNIGSFDFRAIRQPRDIPVGTRLFTTTSMVGAGSRPYGRCTGVRNILIEGTGPLAAGFTDVYASGVPGIGYRFTIEDGTVNSLYGKVPHSSQVISAASTTRALTWSGNEKIKVEVIKTTPLIDFSGTLKTRPGQYVRMRLDSGPDVMTVSLAENSFNVVPGTCSTPDVAVNLDAHASHVFRGRGSVSPRKNFAIELNNCPSSIRSIQYQLDALTAIVDATNSVVSLNTALSTATGVGVQVLSPLGSPFPIGRPIRLASGFVVGRGGRIPLAARFYQTGSSVSPGTASTMMSFTITYQ